MQEKIKQFEEAIGNSDVAAASARLTELYDIWDSLDEENQQNIKSLEPVYLTLVQAAMQHNEGSDTNG